MTLALLKSIVVQKKYNTDDVICSYMDFANNINMLGRNTRKLFKGIKTVKGYTNRFYKLTETEKANMQSNGCLMRATPLVFVDEADIKTDVYLSNPNTISYYCVYLFVNICKLILNDNKKSKDIIKNYCIQFISNADCPEIVKTMVTDSFASTLIRDISGDIKGWVCTGLYIALYTFWNYDTFEDAMHFVIFNRPRTDTDTNASITGALFGAYLGLDKLQTETHTLENIRLLAESVNTIDNYLTEL
jgi:ADP-ribosylglycohydrolase